MSSSYSNRSRSASSIIAIIAIFIITSFSLSTVEAQNMTNKTAGRPSIDDIISVICASDATGGDDNNNNNNSSTTNSTTQTVVDIRCLLREARNAISADATNEALQLIDEAENKVLSAFGDNNVSSSSSPPPSTGNVNTQ
jgi:hypothetical protein